MFIMFERNWDEQHVYTINIWFGSFYPSVGPLPSPPPRPPPLSSPSPSLLPSPSSVPPLSLTLPPLPSPSPSLSRSPPPHSQPPSFFLRPSIPLSPPPSPSFPLSLPPSPPSLYLARHPSHSHSLLFPLYLFLSPSLPRRRHRQAQSRQPPRGRAKAIAPPMIASRPLVCVAPPPCASRHAHYPPLCPLPLSSSPRLATPPPLPSPPPRPSLRLGK